MKKIIILAVAIVFVVIFYQSGGQRWFAPQTYQEFYLHDPLLTAGIYFFVYVLVAALSIPGAGAMTIIAGMIFGLATGSLLVSFASTIGASLAFLISRGLLRDWVQNRFGKYLEPVNKGVEKEGGYYLFGLRLIPVFPFFIVNLVMGLTSIKLRTFYWVSQLGMLPATIVYVNAGVQIGNIEDLTISEIVSPGLIFGFILLGIFPFIAKKISAVVKSRRIYKSWNHLKPRKFDTNMIVIGAGSAGLVSSYIAAAVNAKVTLIEKHKMGGDCLNTGCVPSKAILRSAKIRDYVARSDDFGINSELKSIDFQKVMNRVHQVIKDIEPHDSIERYSNLGVDCVSGDAEIISPWQVKIGDKVMSAPKIILATGAEPFIPDIPGLSDIDYLTSDNLWDLQELPENLLVLGTGPIGCEMTQAFQSLGSRITLVGRRDRILPRDDEDVSKIVTEKFLAAGVNILSGYEMIEFRKTDAGSVAVLEANRLVQLDENLGSELKPARIEVPFDKVLVAVGRKARTQSLGFDKLGLEINSKGQLEVDEFLRTKYPNVFACGDLVGPYQFTHVAAHQAWYAAVNALFGRLRKFKVDYSVIPWATFTSPEVAQVGLNEIMAKEQGVDYDITKYELDDLDRAIADSETVGFVKVLTVPGKDKILGATIVGYQAGTLIAEFVLAMKHGLGLNKVLGTIHIYPTMSEANKYVAGEWRKRQVSEKTMQWLSKYHAFFR